MKARSLITIGFGAVLYVTGLTCMSEVQSEIPIRLHPENPHYFMWRGQPTILITSAEHYGTLLNLDFDYRTYLDTLADQGMNLTRVFSGAYCEPQGAFNITRNTLAPLEGRLMAPWKRSDTPGYANGGNKFDLDTWDPAYFERLRDLMEYAQEKGVVIEFTFFCPMYRDMQWDLSPMNAANNINGVGGIGRNDVYTLDRNGGLLAYQEALTRKLTEVLNPYDNVMLEIANEPYFGGVTMEWQHRIADLMIETEKALPNKHLITQNIANKKALIEKPHPGVSVFNFHYATPPDAVGMNYHLNKVIGDNETGFRGNADEPYRKEAWDFIMAGGGLFNHLDYSFAVGFEDGTFEYPSTQPGGGNTEFRRQMRILGDFIRRFDFVQMHPDNSVIRGGVPEGGTARALVQPGKAMAIYVVSEVPAELEIQLSKGEWTATWTDTLSGDVLKQETVSGGGVRMLSAPPFKSDIALGLIHGSDERPLQFQNLQ